MPENPYQPPKEVNEPRTWQSLGLVGTAILGFILGSSGSLAFYIFGMPDGTVPLPPAIHMPIYWLWAIVPLLLDLKNESAALSSAIAWGLAAAILAVWIGRRSAVRNP